jgi:hypothetical protein
MALDLFSLKGQNVLITGATRGMLCPLVIVQRSA